MPVSKLSRILLNGHRASVRMRGVALGVSVAATITAACTAGTGSGIKRSCDSVGVSSTLEEFAYSLTRGDSASAVRLIADEPEFRWYSVGTGNSTGSRSLKDVEDRAQIRQYLDSRFDKGEHLEIESFRYTGYRDSDDTAHFAVQIRRVATDLKSHVAFGKGALKCGSSKIIVLSY